MLEIRKIHCLHMDSPMGIDEAPYFSWKIVSDRQNVLQTAYCIVVEDESGESVWNTGKRGSDQSTFIPYEGRSLDSSTEYSVTVTIWDNHGDTAEEKTTFETAYLHRSDWEANWVKSPYPVTERGAHLGEQPEAVYFRRNFTLREKPVSARVYATCHGVYTLHVNGSRPDERVLAPEFTVYRSYLCYQTYDVTELLRTGENVLGMHVGDGWYHGFMLKTVDPLYDPAFAVLFQIDLTYPDGSTERICPDDKVFVARSPVLCSDLFAGERYDANAELPSWDTPEYCQDPHIWEPAVLASFGYDNLKAQLGQAVLPVMELPVKEILTSPKGEKILDFGQVIAGRVRIHTDAPKGTKITVTCTEGLDECGNFFDNHPTADQRIEYTANGADVIYEPHFTFMGFRYILVDGVPELKKEDYTAVILSSGKEEVGTFSCSNADVNRLYENTRWSQRANTISIPTDCPQREKAGWLGDIQVYTRTAMQNEDLTPFLTRWLRNMTEDQRENGSLPMVVPLAGAYVGQYEMLAQQGNCPGALAPAGWADAAVLVPWHIYEITGNRILLKEQYPTMKKWCDFIIRTSKENRGTGSTLPDEVEQYLWNTGFHYGEHLIPSYSKDGYGPQTYEAIAASTKYVAPIFGYCSVSTFAEIAGILGDSEEKAYYADIAEKMKNAIQKGVIGEGGKMPADLMGAYALMIYYDLVPEELKETFSAHLVRKLEEADGCLDTGFLATPVLQDALCKIGREDLAYSLLFQHKAPSWLYEVDHGATTIWESWFAMDEDGKPFESHMGEYTFTMSLNHYAFGCVDDWMFRKINGIDSLENGFKKIRIAPRPDRRLTSAARTFDSEYGEIATDWEWSEDGTYRLDVKIPCNTMAQIILPNGEVYEAGSGTYSYTCQL